MTTVFILAGGRGTRLGAACDKCPKPLLPVSGRPFIEQVVRFLQAEGLSQFVFLTGYLGDQFPLHFRKIDLPHTEFQFIKEDVPLGTGGALVSAISRYPQDRPFLVLNADSFVPFSLQRLIETTQDQDGGVVAVHMRNGSRFGSLEITADQQLVSFKEKQSDSQNALINAGIYVLSPKLFKDFNKGQYYSLEKDLFPHWIRQKGRFRVFPVDGPFLDIGTPETLAVAADFIQSLIHLQRAKGTE
jgi:D-glycero-alpha-D-manno-heptose 1-phosphate guanylyltransferase